MLVFFILLVGGTLVIESTRINKNAEESLTKLAHANINLIDLKFKNITQSIINFSNSSLAVNNLVNLSRTSSFFHYALADFINHEEIEDAVIFNFSGNVIEKNTENIPSWFTNKLVSKTLSSGNQTIIFDKGFFYVVQPISYYDTTQGGIALKVDALSLIPQSINNDFDSYQVAIGEYWKNTQNINQEEQLLQTVSSVESSFVRDFNIRLTLGISHSRILNTIQTWLLIFAIFGIISLIPILLIARRVGEKMAAPLIRLAQQVDAKVYPVSPVGTGDELEALALAFDNATKKLIDSNTGLEVKVLERTEELEQEKIKLIEAQESLAVKQKQLELFNSSLQQRIAEALVELRDKDQIMISQSRQASMGEMIGNIAHQWRQPLNALGMVLANIQMAQQYNELTAEVIKTAVDNGNRLIQKMSTTIDDFRNFFLPDKEAVSFSARSQIDHAVSMVEAGLKSQNIQIHLEVDQDVMLTGFPNEYSQVILNLLSNARGAIEEKNILEGSIKIRLFERDGLGCVSICDNGGGIGTDVIDKIFEPYFSTKDMGTGIGLYMSKMIIERSMHGTIEAHNIDGGAEFIVSIHLVYQSSKS